MTTNQERKQLAEELGCWYKDKNQYFDIAMLNCNLDKPKHEECNSVELCGGRIRAFNEKKIDSMATVILEQAGKLYYEFDRWNKCYKDEENYYRIIAPHCFYLL